MKTIKILVMFLVFVAMFQGVIISSLAADNNEGKVVTAIEVKGNSSISGTTVLSKMKTRVGATYSENIINDDLKRLYLSEFFSDIDVKTVDHLEGVKIIIVVTERPIIEKLSFSGFSGASAKQEKFENSIKSRQGQYLDYPTLKEDSQILKKMYVKKGFPETKVEHKVDINKENNKARVQFIIRKGTRIKIHRIYVEGNDHFLDKKILGLIKTKRAWLFGSGVYKKEVIEEDMDRIKSFYRKNGFTDVEASYSIKDHERKALLYITITISEGKQYFVGKISFEGNTAIDSQVLYNSLESCFSEMVYSDDSLARDRFIIQGLYFDRGYIMADVQTTTVLNPNSGAIDITYHIMENQIAYVEKIKIRGNTKTKDVVVRRELRILPGDRFDGPKLRRSKERLGNLGFFEAISYDTEPTNVRNKRDLIVDVKEAKTGTFSFGGGYSTIDSFMGFIEIEQKNFDWNNFPYFTGDGQDLKLRAEMGTVSENFSLSFTEPWLYDYPISFGFDLYQLSHDRETDIGWGYDETKTGGDLRLGKELSEHVRGSIAYRFERIEIGDVVSTASTALKNEEGKNDISSVEFGLSYDTRDNVFKPSRGVLLNAGCNVAGGVLGSDKDFYKVTTGASKFVSLFTKSVLELRGLVGFADSYGDTNDIPIYQRFFTGGGYSIRGYEERMVGPVDPNTGDPIGGNFLFVGNVEYTYPLIDMMSLAVFYDTGNVWEKFNRAGSGDLKSGVGFGVRIKTPIGPVKLDYGIPLDKQPGEDQKKSGRIHFSMGSGF